MRHPWLRYVVAACIVILPTVMYGRSVQADANDFTVTNFTADYYLSRANPHGTLHVIEKIQVKFAGYNHGILRVLPTEYKGMSLQLHVNDVTSPSGAPSVYTSYSQSSNEVLKIGDPNRVVTGNQEYDIDYTYNNVITFYRDHDELYWNANGDQWSQPFTQVTATLHLPSDLKRSSQGTACYVGGSGYSGSCAVSTQGTISIFHTDDIGPGQTLTFVAGFQKGYFTSLHWWDYASYYVLTVAKVVVPVLLIGGAGFIWWLKRGRDAKGTGVIIPQYDAPDGMSPLEVGALLDFKVENRDLTATIISLAVRKYICIQETDETKTLVLDDKSYRLEQLNKDWSALNSWEQKLLGGLFGPQGENLSVDLADIATKLHTEATDIKQSVTRSLTDRGYFVSDPDRFVAGSVIGILGIGMAGLVFAPIFPLGSIGWGLVGGAMLFSVFYHFMAARTTKGVAALESIKGLKLYLEVAEKDRLVKLQSPDAPYMPNGNGHEHTVELFEKLLPYAIVLKVEKQWAQQFQGIYTTPPDWYVGNVQAFTAGYLVGSLGSGFNRAVGASFSTSTGAAGSGFGGGFAGGGGGGW